MAGRFFLTNNSDNVVWGLKRLISNTCLTGHNPGIADQMTGNSEPFPGIPQRFLPIRMKLLIRILLTNTEIQDFSLSLKRALLWFTLCWVTFSGCQITALFVLLQLVKGWYSQSAWKIKASVPGDDVYVDHVVIHCIHRNHMHVLSLFQIVEQFNYHRHMYCSKVHETNT